MKRSTFTFYINRDFLPCHLIQCVCVFSSHSFWTSSSLDVTAGGSHRRKVTQEEGHTGFFIHLPFALRALIFLARRIQPFLSLVDREVEFCVPTISSFSTRWAFFFTIFSEKNPVYRDRTHVPTCQKVTRLPLSYRGDRPHSSTCLYFSLRVENCLKENQNAPRPYEHPP